MTILSDREITELARNNDLIIPFVDESVSYEDVDCGPLIAVEAKKKVISYGLSSYGYDLRCANEFLVFNNLTPTVIDPKNFDSRCFKKHVGDECIIPPNSFVLTHSLEYLKMPENVTGICMGKSTYARCGLIANITPLEAGWRGNVTLEISNTTPLPAKLYAGEGIVQVLFFKGENCITSYARRGGKYQNQIGITLPR